MIYIETIRMRIDGFKVLGEKTPLGKRLLFPERGAKEK